MAGCCKDDQDAMLTHRDISNRKYELDKARREHMREIAKDYDILHYEAVRKLQAQCGEIGHNFTFTHLGPLGDPWFHCTACGKSKVQIEHEPIKDDDDE